MRLTAYKTTTACNPDAFSGKAVFGLVITLNQSMRWNTNTNHMYCVDSSVYQISVRGLESFSILLIKVVIELDCICFHTADVYGING